MRKYYLAKDVHVCAIDESAVFLNLHSNQYLAVSSDDLACLSERVEGFSSLLDAPLRKQFNEASGDELIGSLVKRGVLTDSPSIGQTAARTTVSASRAISPGHARRASRRIRLSHTIHFFWCLSYVLFNLRLQRLPSIITKIRKLRASSVDVPGPVDSDAIRELLGIFRRLRTFAYTARGACLLDALVLTYFMHCYGVGPTFIMGLRTKPFLAHAWVQVGDCILDDRIESIQNLTPILAV